MNPRDGVIWGVGGIAAFAALGFFASSIFLLWHGTDPNTARPWSIFLYLSSFWDEPAYRLSLTVSLLVPAAVMALFVAVLVFRPKPIYGDAKWANETAMRKAGLRDAEGVLLGKKGGRYICSNRATHTLLVGPTRAGKGTGVVIPNCLNWSGSLVVLDVKGENYRVSAGLRAKHGHNVFFWSPMAKDNRSHRFNPLDEISKDRNHRVSDVQVMASLLVDVSDRDPMWGLEARSLFVALTLYVLDHGERKTLGEVYRLLASDADLRDVCRGVIDSTPGLSDEARRGLGSYAAKSTKEASAVRSNLQASLRLFENPVVDAATSTSDFSIRDLRRRRMSIYVGTLASQIDAMAPLLRLFCQQTIAVMSDHEPQSDEPHHVLMLLDEFAALGAMDAVVTAFTLLAGYNVRILAVLQGLSWLDRNYGRDTREGVMSCCGNQLFMTTNDETTTAYISQALGDKTVETKSTSKKLFSSTFNSSSRNIGSTGRPLMSKQEIRKLDPNKAIILVEGHDPVLCRKIRYFDDRALKSRVCPAPSVPLLKLNATTKAAVVPPFPSRPRASSAEDDGGPIVPVPDAMVSPQASSVPSATKDVSETYGAFAANTKELFAIVDAEAEANPFFATAKEDDIRRLRETDIESLI